MFSTYFRLIQQSFRNSFVKKEYHRWWAVPLVERMKFGIFAGLITGVLVFMFTMYGSTNIWLWAAYVFVWLFVLAPLMEAQVEKMKQKYDK